MNLDIGCGNKKLQGYVGMDHQTREGVDIVHDIEVFPWPLESGAYEKANASHVMEHIKPWLLVSVMNEAWRVLEAGGEITIRTPYGAAFDFDPTHTIRFQESSFAYFDHRSRYFEIYRPLPWEVVSMTRNEIDLELKTIMKKVKT